MNSPYLLFLCGDVMCGRGIDQILPHPSDPVLYESYIKDARNYIYLAEKANGIIPYPVDYKYIWGDSVEVLERVNPDARIINLETSVTRSDKYWKDKGINYRMHPANIGCITSAGIDCCSLANNHVLDWGYEGLKETLHTLHAANIKTCGAGKNWKEAAAPAVVNVRGKGRIIVLAVGSISSGIPLSWGAANSKPGINLLASLSKSNAASLGKQVKRIKKFNDIGMISIHWGANWGYDIPASERAFAHHLIDAGIDLVHGHSSHHLKGIEVYKNRLILYGCGDFINDYEGITGYEKYRDDLSLMYFPKLDQDGRLLNLTMFPAKIEKFRVTLASTYDANWLFEVLNREGAQLGTGVEYSDGKLMLKWDP